LHYLIKDVILQYLKKGSDMRLKGIEKDFIKLVDLMDKLRAKNGCPWDKKQTHASLLPHLIEECYEVLDTVRRGHDERLMDELGDLLFLVIFYSKIAEQDSKFCLRDVLRGSYGKIRKRHPHVFGKSKSKGYDTACKVWDEMKGREASHKGRKFVLDGIPSCMPALIRASKVQRKAARVGFDWKNTSDIVKKIEEELEEFKKIQKKNSSKMLKEELGDILFSVVNLIRFLGYDSESLLQATTGKFIKRFEYIEAGLKKKKISLKKADLELMESLWQESKKSPR